MEINTCHQREAPPGYLLRRRWFFSLFSLACLIWLVIRSGHKPSRLRYPCQQIALANSAWILPALGLALSRLVSSKAIRRALAIPLVAATIAFMALGLGGDLPAGAVQREFVSIEQARLRAQTLIPGVWRGGDADGGHDVFVVNHVPPAGPGPQHAGVDGLVHLLAEGRVHLYQSDADAFCAAPDGLIAPDDVVLLKVNAAWDQRGMTNTDVVKGLVNAVLSHPDGFTGEVVLVENCEGGPDYDQLYNNAEDVYQSFRAVVNSFGDPGKVSASSWWSFTDNMVGEFDTGDAREGYVWVGNNVSYPKFITGRGTGVSLRNGVWTGTSYDKSRLKLINVPVLKSHNAAGATASLKNFMGVPSIHKTTGVHTDLLYNGFMGRVMNEVIYPCLNVVDAIWVSPSHPSGPEGPYSLAVRTDILMAGVDPVALDYYAAKNVLYPVSGYGRHDPDTPYPESTNPYHDGSRNTGYPYNALRVMLDSTGSALAQGGHDVTSDPSRMTVYRRDLAEGLGWTGGHCVAGVAEPSSEWYFAEGTTRQGFEEWICIANPNDRATLARVTFMTGSGEQIPYSVELPASSRVTVHANHIAGDGLDLSCHVSSGLPVVVERSLYFSYQREWTGGSSVVGATGPAKTWYFAEGYTGEGFDQFICVLNPGDEPADLTFRFQTQEAGEIVKDGQSVSPKSRATFKVNDLLGPGFENSLVLESDRPVVAERPVYFDYIGRGNHHWTGGHCVMGATDLEKQYSLAEGTTREGFEEWLTIQNPNDHAISVNACYDMGVGQGAPIEKSYNIAAGKRFTAFVPLETGADKDVSVRLESSSEFLAERPMYFRYTAGGANWSGGHCLIGSAPFDSCYFAEGYTGDNFQEWLCLGNAGDADSTVEISYYSGGSGSAIVKQVTVPASSRVSLRVNDHAGPGLELSCRVTVKKGPPVVAERPMYFDYR